MESKELRDVYFQSHALWLEDDSDRMAYIQCRLESEEVARDRAQTWRDVMREIISDENILRRQLGLAGDN